MAWASNDIPRRKHYCRKCGGEILFVPRSGFIIKGQPKYYPVNADDRQPHGRRCRLTLDLRAAKEQQRSAVSPPGGRGEALVTSQSPQQGEMFKC